MPSVTFPSLVATSLESSPESGAFLSKQSTRTVPTSLFASEDLQLGAGVVIIQPATNKVVLLSHKVTKKDEDGNEVEYEQYFYPKGRKDIGETLEQCALREGYEESGYRCSFLPLNIPTHAPTPPGGTTPRYPNCEPFYVLVWHNTDQTIRDPLHPGSNGMMYLTFWYMCQIEEDAVKEEGTAMEDEQGYITHLLDWDEAEARMRNQSYGEFQDILSLARKIWESSKKA